MMTDYDSEWNIDDLTDADIYAAIRYLERDLSGANGQDRDNDHQDNGVLICACLYIAIFICLAFLWFYWRHV